MSRLRQVGSAIHERPWLIIVVAALVSTIAFPRVAPGAIGVLLLAGCAGVAVIRVWSRTRSSAPGIERRPLLGWIAIAVVALASVYVFRPVFSHSLDWVGGDWGPQHVVLRSVVDHLEDWQLPHWNHLLSTGDPPLDVYPSATYLIAAAIAILGGLEENLPFVLVLLGVIAHALIAINATRLALRFLPPALAAMIGLLLLVDPAGVTATIKVGLLHNALAQVFALFAAVSIIDALRRPRLATSVSIWIFTALAAVTHPAALLSTGIEVIALLAVAALAHDVPPRRALVAIAHLAIGVMLGAVVWLPLGERIMMYGQHFSDVLFDPASWLSGILREANTFGMLALPVFLGYAGTIAGIWSRRAVPIFVTATALVFLIAMLDAPYFAFDIAPSRFTARLGVLRFPVLLRPFLFIAAGYLVLLVIDHIRLRWRGASGRSVLVASFIAGIMVSSTMWFGCQAATQQIADARKTARGFSYRNDAVLAWAHEQAAELRPDRWARAYFLQGTALHNHMTAVTGLPAFSHGPIPNVLLRERIEDLEPDSLRRFNVRWVFSVLLEEPMPGDPATERIIGGMRIRELATWDGQFARVERGSGRAVVTRLDSDVVEVELLDTTQPALVALGTGYYPRWRATSSTGASVPIYGYPATPGGHRHVVAAWLSPGKTRFTADGPLPSDDDGRVVSLLGLLLAVAITSVWSRRRSRVWLLRRVASLRGFRLPRATKIAAALLTALILVAWGVAASVAPARDLEMGSGVRSTATATFTTGDGKWHACDYVRSIGEHYCGDRAIVRDATDTLVNDGQVGWAFTTPAITITPQTGSVVQVRVELRRRLAGRYWTASSDPNITLAIDGEPSFALDRQRIIELDDREHVVTITGSATALRAAVTFVREDTLVPDYHVPAPPEHPPGL